VTDIVEGGVWSFHARQQAADIAVLFDRHRRPAGERDVLDHVGIERALRQMESNSS
jgi:hypothetical protein